jgi:peptidoglycan/LPS O-acetylase OafA/YrhL
MSACVARTEEAVQEESTGKPVEARHIPVLDPIRGAAALAVCLFHFSGGAGSELFKEVARYGTLGVTAFFVVSGFIIPYSMSRRRYRIHDASGFIVRRLKRLEPPYLASIGLVLALQWVSERTPGYQGTHSAYTAPQLLAHLGYLNAVLGYPWVNIVYWTLAVELQFYVFCALAFPLVSASSATIRIASLLAMSLVGLVGLRDICLLPNWLPLFALGMVTFQGFVGLLNRRQFWPTFTVLVVGCAWCLGSLIAAVGALTALTIFGCGTRALPKWLAPVAWTGTISYSLYLIHAPIGVRVVNLMRRLPEGLDSPLLGVMAAFVISIVSAYAFWYVVERPSQQWSQQRAKRPTADITIGL